MNQFIRQAHRWISMLFVITVIATSIALAQENPAIWMSYVPLFPLALLTFSGLYLFFLPHAARWKRG